LGEKRAIRESAEINHLDSSCYAITGGSRLSGSNVAVRSAGIRASAPYRRENRRVLFHPAV